MSESEVLARGWPPTRCRAGALVRDDAHYQALLSFVGACFERFGGAGYPPSSRWWMR